MKTETERNARHPATEVQIYSASATPAKALLKPRSPMPGSPIRNARHADYEAQVKDASESPATPALKPIEPVPGSLKSRKGRQPDVETHERGATLTTPAMARVKPKICLPESSPSSRKGRHSMDEAQPTNAISTPASNVMKPRDVLPGSPIHRKGRQKSTEAQTGRATSTAPATGSMKPRDALPGSFPSSRKGRQKKLEAQVADATSTPATSCVKPSQIVPGSSLSSRKSRHNDAAAHAPNATSTPSKNRVKPMSTLPGSPLSTIVEAIKARHRERRHWMGIQQVLDRKLESYIRINETDWHPSDDEATRKKANEEVAAKIKAARNGEGDPWLIEIVETNDNARRPADAKRALMEKDMEELAKQLPVASWVKTVPGFGILGLATIIAETGDLSNYANVAKVWKRLGYAPYKGKAGSTWKRTHWRNGEPALTSEEWIENPFSGRRYALIHTISIWLKNKQWIGAAKTDDGVGKPDGKYGEVYAKRRAHTATTHPDWSKQHSHMDGLRKMMKEVLKDLYLEWNSRSNENGGSPVHL